MQNSVWDFYEIKKESLGTVCEFAQSLPFGVHEEYVVFSNCTSYVITVKCQTVAVQ